MLKSLISHLYSIQTFEKNIRMQSLLRSFLLMTSVLFQNGLLRLKIKKKMFNLLAFVVCELRYWKYSLNDYQRIKFILHRKMSGVQ